MKKVAIDVSGVLGAKGGIYVYIQQLINRLPQVPSHLRYALYASFWTGFPDRIKNFNIPPGGHYELLLRRLPQRYLLWLEVNAGFRLQEAYLRKHQVDLFHGAAQILPIVRRLKTVITIHHFDNPRHILYSSRWTQFYFKDIMERSARAADHLIADSYFTKRYITEELGIDPKRVTVIYHGAPEVDSAGVDRKQILERLQIRYAIRTPYIVCVSHINRRKNITGLLKAFRRFLDLVKENVQLVLVGKPELEYYREVLEVLRIERLEAHVVFTGAVEPSEVSDFYWNAEMFVLPSFLEGFGIPLVEAMKCGCPVVASDSTCIPEIVGDAGILVPAREIDQMADAMRRVYTDPPLKKSLIERGKKRAEQFSWSVAAKKTVEVYQKVLSE